MTPSRTRWLAGFTLIFALLALGTGRLWAVPTVTNYNAAAGDFTWTCPAGVTSVQVECWGGGGSGSTVSQNRVGGGGAGGAYAKLNSYAVSAGNTYYIRVGAGGVSPSSGNGGAAGNDSWFSNSTPAVVCLAKGGGGGGVGANNSVPGIGGTCPAGSIGDVINLGGSGYDGTKSSTTNGTSGGGGGGGGTGSVGTAATSSTGATAVTGGGDGGDGIASYDSGNAPGTNAPAPGPGGGGGGAHGKASNATTYKGGDGYRGQVRLTYTIQETHTVTYHLNGGTSGSQTDSSSPYVDGATVTVLNQGTMLKTGYIFGGWNTQAGGGGTAYSAGNTFTITADTTLYAQWVTVSGSITTSTPGPLPARNTTYGTASAAATFTVSGTGITNGIQVTASSGFEVSQASGSGYGPTTIVVGSGTIAATTIYVRLTATAGAATYSGGDLTCSSPNALPVNVTIASSSVGQYPLTLTGGVAQSKYVDGTTTTILTSGTLSATVNGDVITYGGNFSQATAGSNLTVTVTLSGAAATNYSLTLVNPSSLTANIYNYPTANLPNIVFILADDLGYRDIAPFGQTGVKTPQLSRLAAEGMRFTDFYVGSPICMPSRATLLTGKDGRRSVNRWNDADRTPLDAGQVTVAEVLKQAGYYNACIGKWGNGKLNNEGWPMKQGFDFFLGYDDQVKAHSYFPSVLWKNNDKIYLNPTDAANAGTTVYVPGANNNNEEPEAWGQPFGNVCSHDLFVQETLQFLDTHANTNQPFFLYLPYTLPHAALLPLATLAALTNADGLIYNMTDLNQTVINQSYPGAPFGGTTNLPDYDPHCYASMITGLDRDIGRILDKLIALGIAQNTLVVFCSDNGVNYDFFSSTNYTVPGTPLFRANKGEIYEGGIRTPFMAWWPGTIPAGTTSSVVGSTVDLLPTFAEVAGTSTPSEITGRSILPVLKGGTAADLAPRRNDYYYWDYPTAISQRAVRQGNWKVVRTRNGTNPPTYELFDLATDINEATNLATARPDILNPLIPLVDGSHEATAAFRPDDEFFSRNNLTPAYGSLDFPFKLTPTGAGTGFNYLPFVTGLNQSATFYWKFQFPSAGAAAFLLGTNNNAAQTLAVRFDPATRQLSVSYPGKPAVTTNLPAADFTNSIADCRLALDPVTGAGQVFVGSSAVAFNFATAVGPLRFWGYQVETAMIQASQPRWRITDGTLGRITLQRVGNRLVGDYAISGIVGSQVIHQYSPDLQNWYDNPPGLSDIRATGSQGATEGRLTLPMDGVLSGYNQLFLRLRVQGE